MGVVISDGPKSVHTFIKIYQKTVSPNHMKNTVMYTTKFGEKPLGYLHDIEQSNNSLYTFTIGKDKYMIPNVQTFGGQS